VLGYWVERKQPASPSIRYHPAPASPRHSNTPILPSSLPPFLLPLARRGEVRYERVSFAYGAGKTALRDISLHARPGEMIALVGPTGAGKSTLVGLLPAFYALSSGRIVIDEFDVRTMPLATLRAQIAV